MGVSIRLWTWVKDSMVFFRLACGVKVGVRARIRVRVWIKDNFKTD